jgi:hypothetical protein
MKTIDPASLKQALCQVLDPHTGEPLAESTVRSLAEEGGRVMALRRRVLA